MATTRSENSKKRKAQDEEATLAHCVSPDCPLSRWQRRHEQPLDITSSALTQAGDREGQAETLYQPLREWQTRLLFLEPGIYGEPLKAKLRVIDLLYDSGGLVHGTNDKVEYSALSYAWGNSTHACTIICNGEIFHVTEAVYRALQRLRRTDVIFPVWVDAICISQGDVEERSQQVSMMLSIYKQANSVVVWLGESSADTELFLEYLITDFDENTALCEDHIVRLVDGLSEFCKRPWYNRLWVRQEVWAARDLQVKCGGVQISSRLLDPDGSNLGVLSMQSHAHFAGIWDSWEVRFRVACGLLAPADRLTVAHSQLLEDMQNLHLEDPVDPRPRFDKSARSGANVLGTMESVKHGRRLDEVKHLDVVNVLRRTAGTTCADPRDHIYGILGMTTTKIQKSNSIVTETAVSMTIDYNRSTSQVFQDLAFYIIRREWSLSVLYLRARFKHSSWGPDESRKELGLPSWTPDWRYKTEAADWVSRMTSEIYLSPLSNQCRFAVQEDLDILRIYGFLVATVEPRAPPMDYRMALERQDCHSRPKVWNFEEIWDSWEPGSPTWSSNYIGPRKLVPLVTTVRRTAASLGPKWKATYEVEDAVAQEVMTLWDVPAAAERGDRVVAVLGGYTPLVIRPVTDNATYEYVGPALLGNLERVWPKDSKLTGSIINTALREELEARERSGELRSFHLE